MIYRDPELSKLQGAITDLELKNLSLEEENLRLRTLLKQELAAEEKEEGEKASGSLWSRFRTWVQNVLHNHVYVIDLDCSFWPHMVMSCRTNRPFGRREFFFHCSVVCSECGYIEKEANKSWNDSSLVTLIEVANLVDRAYRKLQADNPALQLPDVFASS